MPGGVQQGGDAILVHGHHGLGRPADLELRLAAKIADDIARAASVESRHMRLHIDEMPAHPMIECGRYLPEPRQEQAWFDAMPGDENALMSSSVHLARQNKTG